MHSPLAAIIGLGNPGPEHVDTRHNAGFWWVDGVVARWGGDLRFEPKLKAVVGRTHIDGRDVWLAKPLTFMNASGGAVAALCRYYRLAVTDILVAHDELDLPPGTVRLKKGGGAGGHNGLTDIIRHMERDFWRLRIGVGRPAPGRDLIPYVLGSPSRQQRGLIDGGLARSLDIVPLLVQGRYEQAMNLLHTTNEVAGGT